MTDHERLERIIARQCAYNGHIDSSKSPPTDAWLADFYGRDWETVFLVEARAIIAAAERAGFRFLGPDDGR